MDDSTDSLLTGLTEQGVRLRRRLRGLNGFEAAATLGGLLTEPRLQGQVLRLELLVHFAAAEAVGTRRISYSALKDAFASGGETPKRAAASLVFIHARANSSTSLRP